MAIIQTITIPNLGYRFRWGQIDLVAGTATEVDAFAGFVGGQRECIHSRATVGGTLGNLSYAESAPDDLVLTSDQALETSTITYLIFGYAE